MSHALQESLQMAGGRGGTGERGRMRHGLIVAEVALTLVLLRAAGLLLRSFQRLQSVDPGFNTEHVLSFDLTLPGVKYRTVDLRGRFFDSLMDKLRTVPGVEAVVFTSRLPLDQKSGSVFPTPSMDSHGRQARRGIHSRRSWPAPDVSR